MPGWGVIPAIRVRDMQQAWAFYVDTLGFEVRRGSPEEDHNGILMGDANLMLEKLGPTYSPEYDAAIQQRLGTPSAVALYIEADDLSGLYERAKNGGATVVDPLASRPWGQSEFTVEDTEGNGLTLWKKDE